MADVPSRRDNSKGTAFEVFVSAGTGLARLPIWVWLAPIGVALIVIVLIHTPLSRVFEKPVQEIIAPVVIGLAAGLSLVAHYRLRKLFTLMLACFALALFARELHFKGTNAGFYVAIVVLAVWATLKWKQIREFFGDRGIAGLLTCAFWTFFITKLLDRHYLSFLPGYTVWHNYVEETLETFGHVMVFALIIATLHLGSLLQARNACDEA
ncbi:MAG: hypothetical protein MPJ78_14260 [Hyphomicrobiaceae bacterium]|nr:hypothetical protein [Hyphomicrobiaceae bacterium]